MARIRKSETIRAHTMAAQGAGTVNSAILGCREYDYAIVHINVTSVTGSLAVTPQYSPDAGTTWFNLFSAAFVAITSGALATTGARAWAIDLPLGKHFRLQSVITTGPVSATIDVEFAKIGGMN